MISSLGGGRERWLPAIAGVLALVGIGLLALAWTTPWHSDGPAYFAALDGIREGLGSSPGPADYQAATVRFDQLQDQYRTPKWRYADLGYAALAWAVLLGVVFLLRRRFAATGWTTRRALVTTLPTVAGLGLLLLGVLASAWHPIRRHQVPDWLDTFATAQFGAFALIAVIGPIVLALALLPIFFTKREPGPPWMLRGRGWGASALFSLIYLPAVLGAAIVLLSAIQPGGWAASTGAGVILWSMLNGRAIWLGRAPAQP